MSTRQIEGQYSFGDYSIPRAEIRLRLQETGAIYGNQPMDSPWMAVDAMRNVMRELAAEHVASVVLDIHMKPVKVCILGIGDIHESIVPIRYAFASAILSNAGGGLILLHNHPSGDLSPSLPDESITRRFAEAGKLMGIPLVDHLIVAGETGELYSFREHHPEMFSGDYAPEYIHEMLSTEDVDAVATLDTVVESDDDFAEAIAHARTR